MEKIKILHILEATIGGTRTHLRYLTNYLNRDKFDIAVLISTQRTSSFHQDIIQMKEMGIPVYELKMVRQINVLCDLTALIRILRILQNHKFDIVHTHSSKAGVLGRIAAALSKIPVILYSPHAFAFQGYPNRVSFFLFRLIERMMSRITTKIICVSESEKLIALNHKIGTNEKLAVIPNSIHMNISLPCGVKKNYFGEKLVIGTVGYFRPQKNYQLFLKIVVDVIREIKNVTFLVIGDGEQRPEIEQQIVALDIEEYVQLIGHVENIYDYYSIMDIFALTSSWEGMPYSVLEAMSVGLPVVATDVPGTKDIIVHGYNGLLISDKECSLFSRMLVHLLKSPAKRQELGQNAKMEIYKNYSIESKIHELEKLYEALILNSARKIHPENHNTKPGRAKIKEEEIPH